MYRFIGCWVMGVFFTLSLAAQTPVERAQSAYEQQVAQDYEGAIATYEGLLQEGYTSADLHFNLGMAYYNNSQLGYAIWQLEKAHKLRPFDGEIDKNLELIRNEQADGLLPLPNFFLQEWWQSLSARLSANAWGVLALLAMVLGCGALAARLWYRRQLSLPNWRENWRNRLLPIGSCLVLMAFLAAGLGNTRKQTINTERYGILLPPKVPVHVAPGEDTDVSFEVQEGLHTRILDEFDEWIKVGLVDGREGWVDKASVGKI